MKANLNTHVAFINLFTLMKSVYNPRNEDYNTVVSGFQSLVLVFAHLMHSQMDAVLEFLCSVPGPTGKTALEFVLVEWCSKQHLFFGSYEGKVR